MIRRRIPIDPRRTPWVIALSANGKALSLKRETAFADVNAGKRYADTLWGGVHVVLRHRDTGETWTRDHLYVWTHTPPAPTPQPVREPLWYERD